MSLGFVSDYSCLTKTLTIVNYRNITKLRLNYSLLLKLHFECFCMKLQWSGGTGQVVQVREIFYLQALRGCFLQVAISNGNSDMV